MKIYIRSVTRRLLPLKKNASTKENITYLEQVRAHKQAIQDERNLKARNLYNLKTAHAKELRRLSKEQRQFDKQFSK